MWWVKTSNITKKKKKKKKKKEIDSEFVLKKKI